MKKIILIIGVLAFLYSCSSDVEMLQMSRTASLQAVKAQLKNSKFGVVVSPEKGQTIRNSFKVTEKELVSLLEGGRVVNKDDAFNIKSIEPVVYKGDTIMMLVKFEKGWKLFSVDKRMPVVLAENFTSNDITPTKILNNPNIHMWIEETAYETKELAKTDKYDPKSESLMLWSRPQGSIVLTFERPPVPGRLEFLRTDTVEKKTIFYPHVTKTLWHDSYPFNTYMPLKNDGVELYKMSCTAVSTGQYLYSLQNKRRYSFQMPTQASATGGWDNYVFTYSNMQPMDLSALALTDNYLTYNSEEFDNVARILGYVSYKIGVKYTSDGASTGNYVNVQKFLNSVGVKGKFVTTLNYGTLEKRIQAGEPTITRASDKEDNTSIGHMYLLDGYKYDEVILEDVFWFLADSDFYDPNRKGDILRYPRTVEKDHLYQFNWGWDNSPFPTASDADDTYYYLGEPRFSKNRMYFLRED